MPRGWFRGKQQIWNLRTLGAAPVRRRPLLGWLPVASAQSAGQLKRIEGPQFFALVDLERFAAGAPDAVLRGVHEGQHRFLLRPSARYRLYKLDAQTLRIGVLDSRAGRRARGRRSPPSSSAPRRWRTGGGR
ncbi:MAG: hypothetical protein KIT58_06885 [Planctomycetota bacterium]|nr:hypothetical protein [Planctomycetota bacterium]